MVLMWLAVSRRGRTTIGSSGGSILVPGGWLDSLILMSVRKVLAVMMAIAGEMMDDEENLVR